MGKKRFPFRLCLQLLIFSALLAIGAAILIPLWRVVDAGVPAIRDGLIARLEGELGREIRYSSISPSIFGAFDIRDLSVAANGESPVLSVARFRVSYSFADLLLGRTLTVRSVRLDSPIIDFDTARDADILDLLRQNGNGDGLFGANGLNGLNGRNGGQPLISAGLPGRVTAQMRNASLTVRNGDDRFHVGSFNLSSEIYGSSAVFDARWSASVSAAPLGGTPVSALLMMRLEGSGCLDSREAEGVFSIPSITGDATSAAPLRFDVLFRGDYVSLRMDSGDFPLDISFGYGAADGAIEASLYARDFRLGDMLSFSGGLGALRRIQNIELSGAASLRRDRCGGLSYEANLIGADPGGSFGGMGAFLEIDASGDGEGALVRNVRLYLPESDDPDALFSGGVSFSGGVVFSPLAAEGTVSLEGFGAGQARNVNADIDAHFRDGLASLSTGNLRVDGLGPAEISASLRPSGESLAFEAALLWRGSGAGPPGTARLQGAANSQPRSLYARLLVDDFPARYLAELAMPDGFGLPAPVPADAVVSAEAFLHVDDARFRYSIPAVAFSGGEFSGAFSVFGTENSLEIGGGSISWRDETVLLSGGADFGPARVGFHLNAEHRGVEHSLGGTVVPGRSVAIRGGNGLDVRLDSRDGREYTGHVRAESFPVPFLGNPAFLSVDARLDYNVSGLWALSLERLEAANIATPAGPARAMASGTVTGSGAVFPALVFEDSVGRLSGGAEFSWLVGRPGFAGRLSMEGGAESYRLEGTFIGGEIGLAVSASSARMYRFSAHLRHVVADADMRVAWDPSRADSFRAELDLSSARGRAGSGTFLASARASLDYRELALSDLRVNAAGISAEVPRLSLNRADGILGGNLEFSGALAGRPISGAASIYSGFEPTRSWAEIGQALDRFDGAARVSEFRHGDGADGQDFAFAFSRGDGAIAVSGGPRNMLRFRMDRDDNFFLALSSPFPVRGSVAGSIRDGEIDARCSDLFVDLGGLFAILPEIGQPGRGFSISDGYVTASLDIRGPLRDPGFYGFARGTAARIQVPFVSQDLRPIPFTAVFDGDQIRFGPVPTAVGSGAGTVAAAFHFERWVPDVFSIDIAVPRESPIPLSMNLTGFLVDGYTAGTLNVSMEDRMLALTGDLWANHTELGVDLDEIGSDVGVPFANVRQAFTVDMTITSGPAVEFFYPSARFPIVRATPEMGTRIYVSVDSAAGRFSVDSDVRVRSGEVFYFQRSFYIRSGLLTFRVDENNFDPLITTRAEVRDRVAGGPVIVSMVVENEPLRTFTARFESSPPLSQVEIFSLLGQNLVGGPHVARAGAGAEPGIDPAAEGPDPMRAFLVTSSDLIAQFTVVRAVEQQVRNLMGLDMFSVRTQALQNAFFMATGVMQPPVDTTGRLGHYFDNTTIFGGRYFGQNIFVQGMLSMRADEEGDLEFQPEIGIDFQGPMISNYNFRIRWDFSPSSPENWFVNDNSITLTFSRVF